jgi:hypothetical protein
MKSLPAILFALGMTAVVVVAMLVIGGNALANTNTTPVTNSPNTSAVANASFSSSDQAQLTQLQQLVSQYQDREKQYQQELADAVTRLNDANTQLQDANTQLQQYQQLVQLLQQRGIITITSDGQVMLGRGVNR